jgi:hypothetical protein
MPKLSNDQWEKFAEGMGKLNMNQSDAVRYAGFRQQQPHSYGNRLKSRPEVAARIEEYRAQTKDRAQQLDTAHQYSANVEAYTLDWLVAQHHRLMLVADAHGKTSEARAALVEIGKLRGAYVDRSEVTHKRDPLDGINGAHLAQLASLLTKVIDARSNGAPALAHQPTITIDVAPTDVVEALPAAKADARGT